MVPTHEVMVMNVRLAGLVVLLASAACSGDEHVDLGSGPIEQHGSGLVAFSGSWDGYAEGYTFADGSDRVRLMLDANGSGGIQVGDSQPAVVPAATSGYYRDGGVGDAPLKPGYDYPISGARVESDRLRAGTDPMSYFAAYCSQLTPHAVDPILVPSGFSCSRGGNGYSSNGSMCSVTLTANGQPATTPNDANLVNEPIDCGLATCTSYCTCDANGCEAMTYEQAHGSPSGASFDGALEDDGGKLVGTLVLGPPNGGTRLTVRLTRD
jgi:hypothetical protein